MWVRAVDITTSSNDNNNNDNKTWKWNSNCICEMFLCLFVILCWLFSYITRVKHMHPISYLPPFSSASHPVFSVYFSLTFLLLTCFSFLFTTRSAFFFVLSFFKLHSLNIIPEKQKNNNKIFCSHKANTMLKLIYVCDTVLLFFTLLLSFYSFLFLLSFAFKLLCLGWKSGKVEE